MSDPSDEPTRQTSEADSELTHTDESGAAQMVDVSDKPDSHRRAVAEGSIHLQPSTIDAIEANGIEKGDVLATARIGAIQAVKHTWETIPLCHQIPITNIDCEFTVNDRRDRSQRRSERRRARHRPDRRDSGGQTHLGVDPDVPPDPDHERRYRVFGR